MHNLTTDNSVSYISLEQCTIYIQLHSTFPHSSHIAGWLTDTTGILCHLFQTFFLKQLPEWMGQMKPAKASWRGKRYKWR